MTRWLAAGLWLCVGCSDQGPPRDQWVVAIASDAPVPQLGDRLLVEIFVAQNGVLSGCDDCARQFAAEDPALWPITFGVVPPDGGDVWIRARLYRSAELDVLGYPDTAFVIDRLAKLPAAREVTDVALELRMSCLGVPADLDSQQACDPATRALGVQELIAADDLDGLVEIGSWPAAQPVDCAGDPPENMVCHPGGILILGSTQFIPISIELNPIPERLVQLSPFWMDVDEMSVGALRPLLPATSMPPVPHSNDDRCTWSPTPEGREAFPVNCVSGELAAAVCEAQGKRLPTEAEWEYAASNAGQETAFAVPVLVQDAEQLCDLAVIGVGMPDVGHLDSEICVDQDNPRWLRAGGHPLDVSSLGVRNLVGSVAELTRSRLSPYADPGCWGSGVELLVDPDCDAGAHQVLRGGDWASRPGLARSAARDAILGAAGALSSHVGFRCVKDASP